MNLLPYPRKLRRQAGQYTLPPGGSLFLSQDLRESGALLAIADRIQTAAAQAGCQLSIVTGPRDHPQLAITFAPGNSAPAYPEGYRLLIQKSGVRVEYRDPAGARAAAATLGQILHAFGPGLPLVAIDDWPDFPRRGVMLDVSRGRVPNLRTLLNLAALLAGFKINELQLYTEHTFAYRNYPEVWDGWGPITPEDILKLDARCRELGIDLVPNQNSFGHLRYWLENPRLKHLAEVQAPYEGAGGTFLRYPTTLAPENPGTLPFLRELYDELLPCFSSRCFNVGCDETWDLGRGQSKDICERRGKSRVYLDFLLKVHRETKQRGRRAMFWGDIILHHPELIRKLPKDVVALNWGYEANHPFERETATFGESGVPFYVCPGTSTWMTLIGRHDNAFANLRAAAHWGKRNGACGYLNTDWGDGGHPQPLAVSHAPFLLGAALSWCAATADEKLLGPVLSQEVFHDPTGRAAEAALGLGFAHRRFEMFAPNVTPFGTVVTAPPPKLRELVCRDGLKYFARIPESNIRAAWEELESWRNVLYRARPSTPDGDMLTVELDMAARMAAQSCHFMLWQQAMASGQRTAAARLARQGITALKELQIDFNHYWPWRNKGSTAKCSPFLAWRIQDYRRGNLPYTAEQSKVVVPKTYAAE